MINSITQLTAVTGFPLEHTLSPLLHNTVYEALGIHAVMLAFPQQDIAAFIQCMKTMSIQIVAVTIPHKQTIMPLLDSIDPVAKIIGAVNTVINKNGELIGYNTDIAGIAASLKNTEVEAKNVLILGAGGAAQPAAYYVQQHKGNIFCLNRTYEKSLALVKAFGGKALTKEELKEQPIDIIINTTPVGMGSHEDETPLSKEYLGAHQTVFDVIYNPLCSKLLKEAAEVEATTLSGLTMFMAQAYEQIRLWTEKTIPVELDQKISRILREQLRG